MTTLLSALWSITWGSWLTALAICLVRLIFRRSLSGKAKYYLWLLLALRLMLPVLPQSPTSVQNLLPQSAPAAQTVFQAQEPAAPDIPAALPAEAAPEAITATAAEPAAVPAPSTSRALSLYQVLEIVYLAGALLTLLIFAALYLLTARQLRRLPVCRDNETLRVWLNLQKQLGLRQTPTLRRGGQAMSGGLLRPSIVLPAEIAGESAVPILVHEAMHLRAHDLWLQGFYRLLLALNWFNPVVWLCFLQAFRDSEGACDQRVLESGLVDRGEYARALYLESAAKAHDGLYIRTAFGSKHSIRQRIAQISRFSGRKLWMAPLALVLALAVSACTLTARSQRDSQRSAGLQASSAESTPESAAPEPTASALEADRENAPYVPLTFDGTDAGTDLPWGSTPEQVRSALHVSEEEMPLSARGKNFSATLEGLEGHPEVRKIVYEFHLTDLALTKGLDQVEIFYEDGDCDLSPLRSACEAVLGSPDDGEGSWTSFPNSSVTLSDVNNLKLTVHWFGRDLSAFTDVDVDSYMESLMPPNGHYGWTYQQHVDAGLLDPSNGTLSTALDGSQVFETTLELGGRQVNAAYFFIEPLLTRGTGNYVLTEVYVQPPEDVPFSQWLEKFSDSFTDKMYARSLYDYITPLMVGSFLTEEQQGAVFDAAMEYTGEGASTAGWPLATNWYDQSGTSGVWKFNGTGYALYLAAQGEIG